LLPVVGHCKQANFGIGSLTGHMKENHIAYIGNKNAWAEKRPSVLRNPTNGIIRIASAKLVSEKQPPFAI
jgi:hypothetical protein